MKKIMIAALLIVLSLVLFVPANKVSASEYDDGYDRGYDDGYDEGFYDGKNDGYSDGLNDGYDRGYDDGYSDGFNDGYNVNVDNPITIWGPLENSTIKAQVYYQDFYTTYNFNSCDEIKNDSFLDFSYIVRDTYLQTYGNDDIPSDFSKSFDIEIIFNEPILLEDLNFFVKGASYFVCDNGAEDGLPGLIIKNEFTNPSLISKCYFHYYNQINTLPDELVYSITFTIDNWSDVNSNSLTFDTSFVPSFIDEYNLVYNLGMDFGNHEGYKDGYGFGYNVGYTEGIADDLRLDNLFWAIGGIPFESFKSIWNVNFLGINLAEFMTGLILALIAIWVIKKVI